MHINFITVTSPLLMHVLLLKEMFAPNCLSQTVKLKWLNISYI